MSKTLLILSFSILFLSTSAQEDLYSEKHFKSAIVVDDDYLNNEFIEGGLSVYESRGFLSLEDMARQLVESSDKVSLNIKPKTISNASYSEIKKSVLMIGLLYRHNENSKVNTSPATAFIIDESGICVTNYHVFETMTKPMNGAMLISVMDCEGNTFPIEEILCSSKEYDLAVFKICKKNVELQALPLSNAPAKIGEEISLISHPTRFSYQYSRGFVNRYYYVPNSKYLRMATSVQFAVGSSGGPLYNKSGELVAVVSHTIAYKGSTGNGKEQQMVNYETIPVSALKKMIE